MKTLFRLLLFISVFALVSCKAKKAAQQSQAATASELAMAQDQVSILEDKVVELNGQMDQLRVENERHKSEKVNLQNQLTTAQIANAELSEQVNAGTTDESGVWFRVQIGAFATAEKQMDESLDTSEDMTIEQDDSMQKLTLGQFRSYQDAKRLQQYLLETVGLKGAWVVSYRDGQRVPISEVEID